MSDKEIPKAVLATMELLIRRKHGLISDQDWQLLSRLDSHIDDFKQNGKYGGIELMAMGTSQFSFTQDTFSKDFVAAMYARVGTPLHSQRALLMLLKVLTNSLTLITPTLDPLGIVLDPTLGHINHSCDPNAYIMMDGAKTSVRSLKPIKKGEEIYISYIDTTNPFSRRQSELSDRWFFTCKCSKCLKGPTQLEDKWIKDVNKLPEKWKAMGENLIKNDDAASDPTNYVGNSVAERRIAAIQGKAFEQYEIAQRASVPKQAINEIEDGMRLCHDTGLWPIHRQPYAALRDDLIVNLLSVGDFRNAWAHCVKRYRDILPKLYPKESHPVRVVQNWQMASLALYLSGEVDSIASGADMGVIAYMLVGEVKQASESSHGEDNAFTKSVRKKFEDMTIELHSNLGAEAGNMIAAQMSQQRQLLIKMGNSVPY